MAKPISESSRAKVAALLNPRNVVIVGATDRPGSWSGRVWRNLRKYGFPGPVFPFNPGRERVWDTTCFRRFEDLPEAPDHLVVLVPAAAVPGVLCDAARAGARSATVMSSGFEESQGKAGRELGAKLRDVIAETGIALSGPNCMGNISSAARMVTSPDDRPQRTDVGPVAVVGQSGGLVMALKRTLEDRGNSCGYVVTSGNESGLTTADYIRFFAAEPTIRVIVSYLESVHDPVAFLDACRAARAAGKPVVVMKLGASAKGREAALAHTGALAGTMEAFDAVAGAAGAVRVRTMDDVIEMVEFFLHAPLPGAGAPMGAAAAGIGLGAITFSGGLRGLCLDAAAANGLSFGKLSAPTRRRLEKVLGVGSIIGNPLDSGFAALSSEAAYLECVGAMLDDPGIDILLLQEELPRGPGTERKEGYLRAVNRLATVPGTKPIVYISMISYGLNDYSRTLRADLPHVAFLQEVEKSLRAIRGVSDYAANTRRKPPRSRAPSAAARKRIAGAMPTDNAPRALSEVESKELLKAYKMGLPREVLAASATEAARHARQIGFPVVMKGVSADLLHKSDVGAVVLGIESAAAARQAYTAITDNMRRAGAARIDGVLVAEQMTDGLELVIGAVRDPEMGPVIMFGDGGVNLELHKDVAFAPPPLDRRAAERLIDQTRVARLLRGYRGKAALDRKAVAGALVALSQLVADLGDALHSIDINPLLARREGQGAVALDGLVITRNAGFPEPFSSPKHAGRAKAST